MAPVQVLCVCTHNRTRSVLMGGLLTMHMTQAGVDGSTRAAGLGEPGKPVTSDTVRLLAERGVDVQDRLSRRINGDDVAWADLILTAERMHVVEIVGRWPEAFPKTLTLPELVSRAKVTGRQPTAGLHGWLEDLSYDRPRGMEYLDADDIGEIDDPTGGSPVDWRECADRVDALTRRTAALLAAAAVDQPLVDQPLTRAPLTRRPLIGPPAIGEP
jgi:protein-tyrosine phosphatase